MKIVITDKTGREYVHELDEGGMRYMLTASFSQQERVEDFGSTEKAFEVGRIAVDFWHDFTGVLRSELKAIVDRGAQRERS